MSCPRNVLRTVLLTGLVCLSTGLAAQDAGAPEARLQRALEALSAGDFARAETLFRGVIASDPGIDQAYLGLAESLLAQGRGRQAAMAAAQLAQRMLNTGREAEARDLLRRTLQIDSELPVTHALLGIAHLSLGEYTEALTALQRAMALGERSTQTRLMLAGAQWELGELAAAEATYREAALAAGGDPEALHQLGSLLLWQGRYAEAVEPLRESVRATTPTPDLLYDLGRALDGADLGDEAVAILARAVAAAPQHAQARYAYARLLARRGDTEAARREMAAWQRLYQADQAMLHESKLEAARVERGWTLLNDGEAAAAAEHFRGLVPSVESLDGLASALAALDDHAGASAALERALALAPERRDLQRRLALERLAAQEQR